MAVALMSSTLISADSEGVYKYRSAVMKAVGGHMASIGASLKGQVFTENLKIHASSMADLADIVPNVFPEGSGVDKSEAIAAIWEQPENFKSRMDDFVTAAKQLEQLAQGTDIKATLGGVQKLGKSCKGCHDDFREEDEH